MADFEKDLTEKVSKVLDDDKVKMIKEAATTYIGWNNVASGRQFFEKVILASPKDYPTDDMRFYQALTELKSRLGRIYDETIAFNKLELEQELLELDLEELESKINDTTIEGRRNRIKADIAKQDINQKRTRISFAREGLSNLTREIEGFKGICDDYKIKGVKPFEIARLEEMDKKIKARYLNHIVTGAPLSPSETAFFYTENGLLAPPQGTVEELLLLGMEDAAIREQGKINMLERAKQLKLAGVSPELPQLVHVVNGSEEEKK